MAVLALVLKIMIPTRLTMGPNRTQDKFRCSDGTGQGTEVEQPIVQFLVRTRGSCHIDQGKPNTPGWQTR